jgi:MoxR-like ATPase
VRADGTYPLPEAQTDRFLLHVMIRYPDDAAELQVLRLVRWEEGAQRGQSPAASQLPQQAIFDARAAVQQLPVAEAVERYMVALISATRYPERLSNDLQTWIRVGASPRGTLALDRAARAHAWLHGGEYVTPDDVRAVVHDCLRHRLILSYEANASGLSADDVINEVVKQVAVA